MSFRVATYNVLATAYVRFHSPALRAVPVGPPLIVDDTPLPSAVEPSDHLALQADVIWA
jgi:hypothetical protein